MLGSLQKIWKIPKPRQKLVGFECKKNSEHENGKDSEGIQC